MLANSLALLGVPGVPIFGVPRLVVKTLEVPKLGVPALRFASLEVPKIGVPALICFT